MTSSSSFAVGDRVVSTVAPWRGEGTVLIVIDPVGAVGGLFVIHWDGAARRPSRRSPWEMGKDLAVVR